MSAARGARVDAAVRELQDYVAGPALDDLMNEAVLRLQGASAVSVEQELGILSEQLGNLLTPAGGKVSATLANGLVYATIASIRTRLATSLCGGTA